MFAVEGGAYNSKIRKQRDYLKAQIFKAHAEEMKPSKSTEKSE